MSISLEKPVQGKAFLGPFADPGLAAVEEIKVGGDTHLLLRLRSAAEILDEAAHAVHDERMRAEHREALRS